MDITTLDMTTFEGGSAQAGFARTGMKAAAAGTRMSPHGHGFDLRVLVPEGGITASVGRDPATFRPGEVFSTDHHGHRDRVAPDGARFPVGRRPR